MKNRLKNLDEIFLNPFLKNKKPHLTASFFSNNNQEPTNSNRPHHLLQNEHLKTISEHEELNSLPPTSRSQIVSVDPRLQTQSSLLTQPQKTQTDGKYGGYRGYGGHSSFFGHTSHPNNPKNNPNFLL